MKAKLIALLTIVLVSITSCYDDSAIIGRLDDHEQRIRTLETLCAQLNTNISSLQTIVTALQKNDYVVATAPITVGGTEIGYTITFTSGKSITIYHGTNGTNGVDGVDGKDGVDGSTPQIGVKKDSDGVYYWTIDGEWLTDDEGNKIPTTGADGKDGIDGVDGENGIDGEDGKDGVDGVDGVNGKDGVDGKDGITPKLEIRDGYWHVSYDNGNSWTQLYKAVGEDGTDGKDGEDGKDGTDSTCQFKSVEQTKDAVILTLADGTTITLPKAGAFNVIFEQTADILADDYSTIIVPFTVKGATNEVTVECLSTHQHSDVSAYMISATEGEVKLNIDWINEYGIKVLIFVSNGNQQVIVKSLTFEKKQLVSVTDAYDFIDAGGTFEVPVTTNLEYDVIIPEDAQAWISLVETKALRTDNLVFSVAKLTEGDTRIADVTIESKDKSHSTTFTVIQYPYIIFADPVIEAQCLAAFDSNKDGRLTALEAAAVTDLKQMTLSDYSFLSFDEFKYFTNVTVIPTNYFLNSNLKSIVLPKNITKIDVSAFGNCSNLTSVDIPDSVTTIGDAAFMGCVSLRSITLPDALIGINNRLFYGTSLESITIPESVTYIGLEAFWGTFISSITIPAAVTDINSRAFHGCDNTIWFNVAEENKFFDSRDNCGGLIRTADNLMLYGGHTIPESVERIYTYAYDKRHIYDKLIIPASVNKIYDYAFQNATISGGIEVAKGNTTYDSRNYCNAIIRTVDNTLILGCNETIIPNTVTAIGNYAFENIDFEDGLYRRNIEIPSSVESIGKGAFRNCEDFNLTIPETVKSMDTGIFENCDYYSVNLSEGITTISAYMFYNSDYYSSGLTTINIPSTVTSIGDSAFYGNSIKSIELPEGLTTIGTYAFYDTLLKEIRIPSTVTSIGVRSLGDSLKKVYVDAVVPPTINKGEWGGNGDGDVFGYNCNAEIYVPSESVDAYKTAPGWSKYADQIQAQ